MARAVEVERTLRMREKLCRDLVSNLQSHSPNNLCKGVSVGPLEDLTRSVTTEHVFSVWLDFVCHFLVVIQSEARCL